MNAAKKFLAENKCKDLELGEGDKLVSDIMIKFHEEERLKMIIALSKRCDYSWAESIATELGDFFDENIPN